MNINDVVAERIAAARARAEATKRRRATQQAARQAGLTARHRVKLARLDAAEQVFRGSPEVSATCGCGRTPDPGVCPIQHSQGLPAGGHCACIHDKPNDPTIKENP